MSVLRDGVPDELDFACPRCGTEVHERYYGPCGACREQLRNAVGLEAAEIQVAAYEPKMNVTPNFIATKD